MKNIVLLFLFIVPVFLFAQYPTGTNKSRLGYQTTGDGLIWRGVAADTAIKPRTTANAYFQLDTVNRVLRRYIATQGSWQVVGGTSGGITPADTAAMLDPYLKRPVGWGLSLLTGKYPLVDSLKVASRYFVGANFFPIEGGTLTGTGGAGFIGFPSQVSAPGTPASGLNMYAQGSSFNFKGTDGYERQFASTLTGGRTYTLPDVSGTFALGTGTSTRIPIWTSTNVLGDSPILYNSTTKRTTWDSHGVIELPMGSDAQRPSPATTSDFWYSTTSNGLEWYNGSRWAKAWESTANIFTQNRVPYTDANGQATTNSAFNFNGTQLLLTPSTAVGKKLFINSTATPIATGIDIDLGGKYSGTATSVPKLAIYNDGTYQFGFGMWNNGLSYIVDHPTLGHYFYAGADSTLKLSITKSLVNFPQLLTVGAAATTGNLMAIGATSASISSRLYVQSPDQGVGSGIVVKSTNTSFLGYASVYLESANGEASQFFSTNSTYTPYRTIAASTFGHYSTAANGMAIQLDGASAVLKVGIGANEITRTTTTGLGILNTSPQRPLHVTGAARITGSAGTPTGVLGRDGNGDIANLTLSGLSISSGTLTAQNIGNTDLSLTSNRTLTGGSFWLNFDANTGIKQSSPTQELDVNGDAYIRDSTRLTTTPAHSAITGLLTRDANGWVGAASLAGGLSYSGGVLTSLNGIYSGSGTLSQTNTYAAMASDGSQNFGIGYFPSFPNMNLNGLEEGFIFSPNNLGEIGIYHLKDYVTTYGNSVEIGSSRQYATTPGYNAYVRVNGSSSSIINSVRNFSGSMRVSLIIDTLGVTFGDQVTQYRLLPKYTTSQPPTTSSTKTVLQWTGDGSNANPAFVDIKTEPYYTVTSTSSPQTLSSTTSDNLINQGGTQATFTLTFPASPVDGQVLKITYNNAITALTLDGNGNTIVGSAVTTGVAGSQRAFKFYTGIGWIKLY